MRAAPHPVFESGTCPGRRFLMKEFRITIGNRPGELARVAESLSKKGVSIKAVCASASGGQVILHLIGHDMEATRAGLQEMRAHFTEQEVVVVLLEDKAGELARVANQLAGAGINLDAVYLTGKADDLVELAFAVDDVKKAKKILG
jgi:hypothetical protein